MKGQRFYDRIWTEHVRPALEQGDLPLTEIVEALPPAVVPEKGRWALYQAMSRRAGGRLKKPITTGEVPS